MVKVARFFKAEGPDHLRIVDEDVAAPPKGQVRLQMRAAGLNRAEWLMMYGQYIQMPTPPSLIGVEGAGVVESLGEGVSNVKVGDEVCVLPCFDFSEFGVIGELANVPAQALMPKPKNLSFEQAAAIGVAYTTGYGGLIETGILRSGEPVVVTAASSSAGLSAIQVAKAHGAMVIATSRTHAKDDVIRKAGADHVIATDQEDFVARVQEITEGKGFNLAFDAVSGPFLEKLGEACAHEARIVEYGALSMAPVSYPLFPAIAKGFSVTGFHLTWNLMDFADRRERAIADLTTHLSNGAYTPILDKHFELADTANAYRYLASNAQQGKVIVTIA